LSFTAVSTTEWWLLGDAPCARPPCTSIVRTTDGGTTFAGVPAPATGLTGAVDGHQGPSGIGNLRFADRTNGFAFGPTMWATHDGAAHWHQVAMPGPVTDLAAADGYAYAVVEPVPGASNDAASALYRSPVGSDGWSRLGAADVSRTVAVHGADVVAQTPAGSPSQPSWLLVSHDHGDHFATLASPGFGFPCSFAEPEPPVIWAVCVTGMQSVVARSGDGGATFTRPPQQDQSFVNTAVLGAASSTTAAVAAFRGLYLTTDGGRTFQPINVRTPSEGGGWLFVGFTDAAHGAALASSAPSTTTLYRTADGGRTWSPVTIKS